MHCVQAQQADGQQQAGGEAHQKRQSGFNRHIANEIQFDTLPNSHCC
jgi:hypothetical protein